MVFDKNHKEVKVGSWVKVLSIEPDFLSTFPSNEAEGLRTMLNQVLEVTEIAHGNALVKHEFNERHSFSMALDSEEMELVDNSCQQVQEAQSGLESEAGQIELKCLDSTGSEFTWCPALDSGPQN